MEEYKYKISVIVPVYKVEEYLEECILSVIMQTIGFEKNIQLILINDGSPDNSEKICLKYKEKYPDNVLYIKQENSGVSAARNNGIKNSEGKYIMLLDSDDTLSKNAINNLVNFFDMHYDEIDIVTYPIIFNKNGKIKKHKRYEEYDKGTGIYDINEYIYLNQSTINIVFKNERENTNLFDVNMKLSEDQDFCTRLLMPKEKIGFVKEAIYYYRRHGVGVSQTINNPYYCFEDVMKYNEGVLEKYQKNGKIPRYIQSLVVNTIKWRFTSDQLLPYHYEKKEFDTAVDRIINIISKIDADILINLRGITYAKKMALIKFSKKKLKMSLEDGNVKIYSDNCCIDKLDGFSGIITKLKAHDNTLTINGHVIHPLLEKIDNLYIDTVYNDGKRQTKRISVFPINDYYNLIDSQNNSVYGFDFNIKYKKVKRFKLYIKYPKDTVIIKFEFKQYASNNFVYDGHNIVYSAKGNCFKIRKGIINIIKSHLRNMLYCFKANKKILVYRFISLFVRRNPKIWLYTDRGDALDNAYVQFKHDFSISDNRKKYYVCKTNKIDIGKYFNDEERKYVIRQGSLKHKMLFIKSDKIITSFIDLQVYCPLNRSIKHYNDLIRYDLIYLQHGILHANLRKMYSKEFTQIDRFVVSTNFEIKNLTTNYHYNKNDLILSGMPRMNSVIHSNISQNKILYAPSWRKYLIGNLVNNKRNLRTRDFVESRFFKEIYDFLHLKDLDSLLTKEKYVLEFKLHPIFREYVDLFELDSLKNISVSFDNVNIDDYKIFITDFSSFQFDFVKLKKPIIYFVPDMKEFKAGLHTYRELDLKYEDAFGNLCVDSNSLLCEIKRIIENNLKVDKKYLNRMSNMFLEIKDPCEKIYKELNK